MHVFWLNGNLTLEPESEAEREALGLLEENVKRGRPQRNDPGKLPANETGERSTAA